ncbi:oxidoreductase [soil metagenome]
MRHQRVRQITGLLFATLLTPGCVRSPAPADHPATRATAESVAPAWYTQQSGTTASFRGLSVVSREVAWASGSGGTFARTADGGATWQADTVPGASALDFRDVYAVDDRTAYLLSAGEGELSRIYKTTDGGRSWTLQHTNPHAEGFFDGFAFRDAENGIAYSDPVEGRFLLITTNDGGASWREIPRESLPPALPGEAGFAASGTGIVVQGDHVWFATGGGAVARVFRSTDRGRSWTVAETPLRAGAASSGIFSLTFWDARNGVAVGGDYTEPAEARQNVAITRDGGLTWTHPGGDPPRGYRSGIALIPGTHGPTLVAVGTSGSDYSLDGGRSWLPIDTLAYNSVGFAAPDAGWAVGPRGRIARFGAP